MEGTPQTLKTSVPEMICLTAVFLMVFTALGNLGENYY